MTDQLIRATADRPELLPIYISLTSGEPTAGDEAPARRGGRRADAARGPSRRSRRSRRWPLGSRPRAAARRRARRGPAGRRWPPTERRGATTRRGATRRGTATRRGAAPSARASPSSPRPGIPVVAARAAADADAAVAAAAAIGGPVVLKLDAVGLAHKSDVGARAARPGRASRRPPRPPRTCSRSARGWRPGADGPRPARRADGRARRRAHRGDRRDPQFGPIVLVGIGGVLAEVLDDVVAPARARRSATRPARCSTELRGARLLDGVRGGRRRSIARPSPRSSSRSAAFGVARPDIRAIDLNPVIAGPRRRGRRRRARRPRGGPR